MPQSKLVEDEFEQGNPHGTRTIITTHDDGSKTVIKQNAIRDIFGTRGTDIRSEEKISAPKDR